MPNNLTDAAENISGDYFIRGIQPAAVAGVWIGYHIAAKLTSAATAGQNQVIVDVSVPVGTVVTVDPDDAGGGQTLTVNGLSGAGPYTLTLSANLTNGHAIGTYVRYQPLDDGSNFREPTGGSYARVALGAGAPATPGVYKNGTNNFPAATADHGLITHCGLFFLLTGGTPHIIGQFDDVTEILNGDAFQLPADSITFNFNYDAP